MSAEPYPHRYLRETVFTGCGWPYRCRCGEGDAFGGERGDNCPAAMREDIIRILAETEDARRLGASIHKAAGAAVDAERAAVVKYLRDGAAEADRQIQTCTTLHPEDYESMRWERVTCDTYASAIENGEHIAKENA